MPIYKRDPTTGKLIGLPSKKVSQPQSQSQQVFQGPVRPGTDVETFRTTGASIPRRDVVITDVPQTTFRTTGASIPRRDVVVTDVPQTTFSGGVSSAIVQRKTNAPFQFTTTDVAGGIVTKTGWDDIAFNAALDSVTLLYVDDSIGWIVVGTNSVTIT